MVPPGSLPNGGRPRLMPGAVAPATPVTPTTTRAQAGTTLAPATPGAPIDISQKMLEALDKYMALQKSGDGQDRGGQVNVNP
jgi:hypothetical protein